MEDRKEAMLKKLAARHEQRLLKSVNQPQKKIDLKATEKAFLDATPSTHTPTRPATIDSTDSPILSFDEAAEKQVVALSTWCNTMIGTDQTEEVDLGATKAEACRKIQSMLTKKSEEPLERAPRLQRLFETNDAVKIKKQCQKILRDSGVDESIKEMLSKGFLAVRNELAVYSDLTVHTSLLRIFLSFHPVWLKAALEAIFDVSIASRNLIGNLSRFLIERVFSNPRMLKNKKFAQGCGKPIVTAAGKEALHRHFLLVTMKLMFLIETAHSQKVIPNLTRIFTKSSTFKCLDEMCSELTKELLSGSSASLKKAFVKIGFTPSYVQSFFENYDYQAKGFADFQDGLILAKLVETVGELKHGELLLKLRDPQGDRIRKVNNVKVVLQKMSELGIHTEDVTPSCIVAGKKAEILAILWSLVGVRVAKEKKVKIVRSHEEDKENPKARRRSAIHDDVSSEVLKTCKEFGRLWDIEVLDLDSLLDGRLLAKIWSTHAPNEAPIESFEGRGLWEKVVTAAETELHIRRGLDQNVALFAKEFIRKAQLVKMYNEKAAVIQKAWRGYAFRKKTPKLYSIVLEAMERRRASITSSPEARLSTFNDATFTIPRTPGALSERDSLCDSTFTVSRDSVSGGSTSFKMPRTPARVTFASNQKVIVEEEEDDEDVTIVPSTEKKRVVGGVKVFEEDVENSKEPEEVKIEGSAPEDIVNEPELQEIQTDAPEDVLNEPSLHEVYVASSEDVQSSEKSMLNEPEHHEINQDAPEDVSSRLLQTSLANEPEHHDTSLDAPEDTQSSDLIQNSMLNEPSLQNAPEDVSSTPMLQNSMLNEPEHHEIIQDAPKDQQSSNLLQKSMLNEPSLHNAPEVVDLPPVSEDASNDSIDNSITQGHLVKRAKDLNVLRRHQQEFVDSHHLDLPLNHDERENIDDLRRLLRETRELKKKQLKVELQASNLRQLERQALANAHCRSGAGLDEAMLIGEESSDAQDAPNAPNTPEDLQEPEEAELGELVFIKTTSKICVTVETSSEVVIVTSPESRAATTIQKAFRGFLARRQVRGEIEAMRQRIQLYRDALLHENDQLASVGSSAEPHSSSIESKLRKASLHGLTSDNLHFVHLGATIIDRITDLVPSLLEKFVVELNGISLIYDILRVADRGIPYKTILQPLFNILHKSFRHVSKEQMEEPVVPLLPKLTGRLAEMLLMYCAEKENCLKLAGVLNTIGRRWPSKKSTRLDKSAYFIEKSIKKTSDAECRQELLALKTVCDLLI